MLQHGNRGNGVKNLIRIWQWGVQIGNLKPEARRFSELPSARGTGTFDHNRCHVDPVQELEFRRRQYQEVAPATPNIEQP
jgi:hypothetical protein